MLLEYFKQYLKISRGVSESSVKHYITGINTISILLSKYNYPINDIFSVSSVEELDQIFAFLTKNEEFVKKDFVGHRMYSVAFKLFYNFACKDKTFFTDRIKSMDIAIDKPSKITTTSTSWKRNQILISQAIDGANHLCEHDKNHSTFIAKSTGKAYMEGHHLIPLKYQNEFVNGIDVYANIVCLCPTCHRLLHFGTDCEKMYVAEKLFDTRSDRLSNSGIDISKKDFLKLVI